MPQFTVVVPLQEPCVVEVDPKVMPPGKVSETLTFVAVAGPLLFTTIRYVSAEPAIAGFGDAVFEIETSALEELITRNETFVAC
jgi:hypothetical protein